MTRRTLVVAALLAAPPSAPADPPAAKSHAARLVERLGSDDFAEREAASRDLAALGPAALDEVRAGCLSADPEVAQRARELSHRIGRRIDNEKALAPTLVELTADDLPLDSILADLSKQSGYVVVLGGLKPDDLAAKKVTVKTGRVPFWDAVRQLGDAADLQIASAGGFTAPGSLPYTPRASNAPGAGRVQQLGADRPVPLPGPIAGRLEAAKVPPARTVPRPNESVVLEARDGGKKRPWAVYGAVCVEAFPIPAVSAAPGAASSLLQLWPEPKLTWKETRGVRVTRADDDRAQKLTMTPAPLPVAQQAFRGGNVRVVQNVNGVVILNEGNFDATPRFPGFQANVRQSVVQFKPAANPSGLLREFAGSVYGVIRSPTEAVVSAELQGGKAVTATGNAAVTMSATLFPKSGNTAALLEVELAYDPSAVQPVAATDALMGAKKSTTFGNETVYGVRVTDAAGNPFAPSLYSVTNRFDNTGRRISYGLKVHLRPATPGAAIGEPATVAFWGTYGKAVEVPFDLRDAPLVVGKK